MRSFRTSTLLALSLLASCSSWFAFTPERAAIRALLRPDPMMDSLVKREIDTGSVQVAQSEPWQDGVAVLLTYSAFEEDFGQVNCLSLYTVSKPRSTWESSYVDSGCWPVGGTGEVIAMSSGSSWGTNMPGESHLAGLVYDRRVVAVEVHWDDGEIENLEVANGAFFSIRAGVHDPEQYLPLDENGEPLQ